MSDQTDTPLTDEVWEVFEEHEKKQFEDKQNIEEIQKQAWNAAIEKAANTMYNK